MLMFICGTLAGAVRTLGTLFTINALARGKVTIAMQELLDAQTESDKELK